MSSFFHLHRGGQFRNGGENGVSGDENYGWISEAGNVDLKTKP